MTENWRVKTARFFALHLLDARAVERLPRPGFRLRLHRLDAGHEDLLAPQRRDDGVHGVADALAA